MTKKIVGEKKNNKYYNITMEEFLKFDSPQKFWEKYEGMVVKFLIPKEKKQYTYKINEVEKEIIEKEIRKGREVSDIARKFGVNPQSIYYHLHRTTYWKTLKYSELRTENRKEKRKIKHNTPINKQEIINRVLLGEKVSTIAKEKEVTNQYIYSIIDKYKKREGIK